jgi:hypothetical protein
LQSESSTAKSTLRSKSHGLKDTQAQDSEKEIAFMEHFYTTRLAIYSIANLSLLAACIAIWLWAFTIWLLYKFKFVRESTSPTGNYFKKWGRRLTLKTLSTKYGIRSGWSLGLAFLTGLTFICSTNVFQQYMLGCADNTRGLRCYDLNYFNAGWTMALFPWLFIVFFAGAVGFQFLIEKLKRRFATIKKKNHEKQPTTETSTAQHRRMK